MLRAVIVFIGLLMGLSTAMADSSTRSCFLAVQGRILISGPCSVSTDEDGSFTMGADGGSPFFAYFTRETRGTWIGYWNGSADSTHAHDPLGTLDLKDKWCIENKEAKACLFDN